MIYYYYKDLFGYFIIRNVNYIPLLFPVNFNHLSYIPVLNVSIPTYDGM